MSTEGYIYNEIKNSTHYILHLNGKLQNQLLSAGFIII